MEGMEGLEIGLKSEKARNFGPVPDTRSRSTVLTDSFNNSAASSWVSSGCISDRLVNDDQRATGGDWKTR